MVVLIPIKHEAQQILIYRLPHCNTKHVHGTNLTKNPTDTAPTCSFLPMLLCDSIIKSWVEPGYVATFFNSICTSQMILMMAV